MSDVIDVGKLDKNFKYEIAKEPGGEAIMYCYACGTCSAQCPINAVREDFNPRRIIHMALLGMKEEVLTSPFVWYCTGCYGCQERCPQGVNITNLMKALMNIATKEGHYLDSYKEAIKTLDQRGRMIEISEFENTTRQKYGLPEIQEKADEIRKLIKVTGAKKLVGEE
jgi:heterodisulfide reductase subunit C